MSEKNNCLLCGAELIYYNSSKNVVCEYCKKTFESVVACKNNHYVCDDCHRNAGEEIIKKICIETTEKNPFIIAEKLMKNPSIHMHGPEHHFLVPAVLLTAYYNTKGLFDEKEKKISIAQKRAQQIYGGFCGTHGVCGAAIGTGIFISIISQATSLSKEEWHLSNLVTAISLKKIADYGGPRCCKRNTFLALFTAIDFLEENFHLSIPHTKDISCIFTRYNNECIHEKCPYFPSNHR